MKPESGEVTLITIITRALGRWLPAVNVVALTGEDLQQLKQRNRRLDVFSQILGLTGILGGVFLPYMVRGHPVKIAVSDIGVLLGLGAALPTLFILLMAAFQGKKRLHEYLTLSIDQIRYRCARSIPVHPGSHDRAWDGLRLFSYSGQAPG